MTIVSITCTRSRCSTKVTRSFPLRHNREFTREELRLLLAEARFKDIEVRYLKSRRHRVGLERLLNVGTMLRDAVPSWRKSLIAFAWK